MIVVAIDFETYYDDECSLRKLSVPEYVAHPDFKVHGYAIATEAGCTYHTDGRALAALAACADDMILVSHNAHFDAYIVKKLYGVDPKFFSDTVSLSRAVYGETLASHALQSVATKCLGVGKSDSAEAFKGVRDLKEQPGLAERVGQYCMTDAALCLAIYARLNLLVSEDEQLVIDAVVRMYVDPVLQLDPTVLETYSQALREDAARVLEASGVEGVGVLRSRPKFADELRELGVEPPVKISPTTGKEAFAFAKTDAAMQALAQHESPQVRALVAAKLSASSTLAQSRTERFAKIAALGQGFGPPYLFSGAMTTHRLSGGGGLNVQNLPRGPLRRAIRAPEGYVLVASDFAQIELRVVLAMAKEHHALDQLRVGADLYLEFGAALFGRVITRKDDRERAIAKAAVLGCIFGMGADRFLAHCREQALALTSDEAATAVAAFRSRFAGVPALWRAVERIVKTGVTGGYSGLPLEFGTDAFGVYGAKLPGGLWIKYPDIWSSGREWGYRTARAQVSMFGGKVVENLAQALAGQIMRDRWVAFIRHAPGVRVVLSTHDELVFLVPESIAGDCAEAIHNVMEAPVAWWPELPIGAETSIGYNYEDMETIFEPTKESAATVPLGAGSV